MKRTTIPIPLSSLPTRIEIYYKGELKRSSGVQADTDKVSLKLPAPIQECEIRIIPCDQQGRTVGRGHVYKDDTLVPEPPVNIEPPTEPEDEFGERNEGTCESSDILINTSTEVSVERPEVDEDSEAIEPTIELGNVLKLEDD